MALRLNDLTAIINRTSGLVAANADYCCCFWYQPIGQATTPDYVTALAITDAGYTAWTGVFGNASVSDGSHQVSVSNGGAPAGSANQIIIAGQAAHIGYRRSGTSHRFLVNGFFVGAATSDLSAVTFAEMLLGNDRFSVLPSPSLFWDFKEWANAKSDLTIAQEMASYGAVASATFLHSFAPLATTLNDTSGNGRHWSGAGNYTFVANPSLPTNLSAATATVISSLPYSATVTETYNLPLWYTYTAQAGESYVGAWGFGGLSAYSPTVAVFTGDGSEEWPSASFQTVAVNVPVQTPVVEGESFYFQFESDFGGAFGSLAVSMVPAPTLTAPAGYFLVTEDSPGYGASIISSTDGTVYRFLYPEFPASDAGAALREGTRRILIVDNVSGEGPELYLFEPTLSLVLTLERGTDAVESATSNGADTFYLAYNPPGLVDKYVLRLSDQGVLDEAVIGPLTGSASTTVSGMALNPDETILYWQRDGNNLGAIHRWDLTGNVALSDLVASPGSGWFGLGALLGMPDGDVIGGFDQFLLGAQGFLRRYSDAGVQQWSYDVGALGIDYHGVKLIPASDFPDSFWLIVHVTTGHSRFLHLDAETGLDLGDGFDVPTFSIGAYEPAESATPEARFGPAPSCFYVVLPEATAPPPVACVLDRPATSCWHAGTPSAQAIASSPSVTNLDAASPTHSPDIFKIPLAEANE